MSKNQPLYTLTIEGFAAFIQPYHKKNKKPK